MDISKNSLRKNPTLTITSWTTFYLSTYYSINILLTTLSLPTSAAIITEQQVSAQALAGVAAKALKDSNFQPNSWEKFAAPLNQPPTASRGHVFVDFKFCWSVVSLPVSQQILQPGWWS